MRLQLFEFLDQSWLPDVFRNAMTAYLAAMYRKTSLPKAWAEQVAEVLRASGQEEIVDLGSGAMGPIQIVIEELGKLGQKAEVTLTDLYPPSRWDHTTRYWPFPVDARRVPASLSGVRTMFAVFHHFAPADAEAILRDAAAHRRAICVFDATSRTPVSIMGAFLIPIFVLVMTPTVRPRSLLFTYLLPVLPLMIFWDGLVSQFRTYSPDEMLAMANGLGIPEYEWRSGDLTVPGLPVAMPYLIGQPTR